MRQAKGASIFLHGPRPHHKERANAAAAAYSRQTRAPAVREADCVCTSFCVLEASKRASSLLVAASLARACVLAPHITLPDRELLIIFLSLSRCICAAHPDRYSLPRQAKEGGVAADHPAAEDRSLSARLQYDTKYNRPVSYIHTIRRESLCCAVARARASMHDH